MSKRRVWLVHMSIERSARSIEAVAPTMSFIACVTWCAAIVAVSEPRTPAVSHVSLAPAGGGSGNMHRRHGVDSSSCQRTRRVPPPAGRTGIDMPVVVSARAITLQVIADILEAVRREVGMQGGDG